MKRTWATFSFQMSLSLQNSTLFLNIFSTWAYWSMSQYILAWAISTGMYLRVKHLTIRLYDMHVSPPGQGVLVVVD